MSAQTLLTRTEPTIAAGDAVRDQAERIVLGAMMMSPSAVEAVLDTGLSSMDFGRPHHAIAYAYLTAQYAAGHPTDPVALTARLLEAGELRGPLTAGYLHECVQAVPTAASAGYYARIVRDHAGRRRLALAAERLAGAATVEDPDRRAELVAQVTEELTGATGPERADGPLDLVALLTDPPAEPAWLAGRLLCAGEQVALVGEGKAGKSLLALEWAARAVAGHPVLGDVARPPIRVLYADQENGPDVVRERLLALGAQPADLAGLAYLSFPTWRPLDTASGGADLVAAVERHRPDVVVLDTISRMISGPEDVADTWLALYRHSLMPLKSRGVASVRLDHTGKDPGRSARGSSAKSQDVDHVWELRRLDSGLLELVRTHTRTGRGPAELLLRRHGQLVGERWTGTWHESVPLTERDAAAGELTPAAERVRAVLDAAGEPVTVTGLGDRLAEQGQPLRRRTIQDALGRLERAGLARRESSGPGRPDHWASSAVHAHPSAHDGGDSLCAPEGGDGA